MDIGVPRERHDFENRVGLTPAGCHSLVAAGHRVYVEGGAGGGSGFTDGDYRHAGAEIVFSAQEAFGRADLVLKVAPLLPLEYGLLRSGQVLLGFQHMAVAPPGLIDTLAEREITAIAYETIERFDGSLPVLMTMSQIAGKMAPQIAARCLEIPSGGHGILLSGVPGVAPAEVCILGAGVVGRNAAQAFFGAGARVIVLDRDVSRLETLQERMGAGVTTLVATHWNLQKAVSFADVLVGAVLIPGARAPVLVTRELVRSMRPRSVILDFSIDQGGCVETSRPTIVSNPVFLDENVLHYCVPNVPSLVARTATHALTNSTLPFIQEIARLGVYEALMGDESLSAGVNTFDGQLVNPRVAASFGRDARNLGVLLESRRWQ